AIKLLLGRDARPPTQPIPELGAEPGGTGERGGAGRRSGSAKKKGRPVLRSYVPSPDGSDSGSADQEDEAEWQSRSPVDQAGVRHVLEYETTRGRIPKEMSHNNPGYDVESRDASGKVVRYIEVKSFSGMWGNTYA